MHPCENEKEPSGSRPRKGVSVIILSCLVHIFHISHTRD